MADMASTPETRREADPFSPMTQSITAPIGPGQQCDDDPHPQITAAQYESGAGTPLPLRPERAAANNRRYGGVGETATPTIPDPIG